ncbi:MAG: bifunctional phosphopantothenoylcysteine decarboxylase/phosphopantothenate--cysteine ligase CoaBC [Anaerolineae bacterium]|nr:bifunctional phosphopantothenoylcysteine decarboxylase/phosphopantothenate--cysteine ligase CoaBC [Anaerolineae bacterium]
METLLQGKRIVLGVCGSIAAYKVADLASKLTQAGALVDVILTDAAQRFITPLTFQALTGRPVSTDLWGVGSGLPTHIAHVGLGESAELLVIAPATANTLAKIAHGLADDLLSVTALAARCPLVFAPAMDGGMYEHPATQANVASLRARGAVIIEPVVGRFASGLEGRGRLPETRELLGHLRRVLGQHMGALRGRRVVVTAGGTREALDPVRYLSNHSSGKQGYALAQAALDAGAEVTLISTVAGHLPPPIGVELVSVSSAAEMEAVVLARREVDVLIMAAAVADFRPASAQSYKLKKDQAQPQLELVQNPDILAGVGQMRQQDGWPRVLVGFAAETNDLHTHASAKLERKNADLIVANDLTEPGAGFAGETNRVTFFTRGQAPQPLPLQSKAAVAEQVLAWVAQQFALAKDAPKHYT